MFKNLLSTVSAIAIFAVAGVAANAADEIDAKVAVCSACHGQNGVPVNATTPIIWGQTQVYLVKQIHDYRAGDRENPIMSSIAKTVAQDDIRKVAAYFESKPWPAQQHPADASATPPEGIAICKACHQPNFQGGPPAPRLAGLSYEYLIATMNDFANDKRTNNQDMPKFMKELTVPQREAIAHYLSAL